MIGKCAEKPGVLAIKGTHGHAREGISGEADPLGGGRFSRIRGGQAGSLLTLQLSFDVAEFYGCVHPVADELLESLVVVDLCSNRPEL